MYGKKRLKKKNKDDLVSKASVYKKLDSGAMKEETFERKPYFAELRMDQARTKFKIQTKMIKNIKLNYKNDPRDMKALWKCSECSFLDRQDHILWCESYKSLRKNITPFFFAKNF